MKIIGGKTLSLALQPDDIQHGLKRNGSFCPIARMCRRMFELSALDDIITVDGDIAISNEDGCWIFVFDTREDAAVVGTFIQQFDNEETVQPITFKGRFERNDEDEDYDWDNDYTEPEEKE